MSDTPNHESDAIEEMISTLVQIAWDAGNQEEEAIFDDEYNQIYDRLLQCINTKDTEIKRLEAENLNLRCCGNCKWCNAGKDDSCYDAQNNICDRWKSDGLTQERRK
jgi:hypothetical protein